jgi:hypothetical protein
MAYEGEGKGKAKFIEVFEGESEESHDNALRSAVHASGVEPGTTLVITSIEIVTVGDPNVGSYKVTVGKKGADGT